ncbi:MAG: hypothetical protein ACLP59_30505 [Bryobacteraceae bacterium]
MRNTLASASFACPASAVPFSTVEYTNVDGAGGGLMGPYAPLVDYVDPSNGNYLPTSGPGVPELPAEASCGVLSYNGTPIYPLYNNPTGNGSGSGQLLWPQQYWPGWGTNTTGSNPITYELNCPTSTVGVNTTKIYYATTQRVTEAAPLYSTCAKVSNSNPCTQIVPQSPQENWDLSSARTCGNPQYRLQ